MNVGHNRNADGVAHFGKDAQGLEVADAGEGVEARAVGLAVGAFESVGYVEAAAYWRDFSGDVEGHLPTFNHARTGQ